MAPPALTVKVFEPTLDVPKAKPSASVIATALFPELVRPTAPLKLLEALVKVITPAPALMVTAPVPVEIAPV